MEPDLAYTYQDHKRYLDAFIEALDLRNVTLVIHDWGSVLGFDYAVEHDDNVVGIAFMESIIPPSFPRSEPMGGPLGRYRTDAGEDLILEQNQFVEQILPGSVVRGLTDEEMEYYRGPYPTPESRIPTLQWPRELPAGGEPARNVEVVTRIGGWMQGTDIPMLFFWARPGALNNEAFAEAMVERVTNIQTAFVATSRTSSKPVPTSAKENTMGSDKSWQSRPVSASLGLPLALAMVLLVPMAGVAQGPGTENGQWTYLGGDAWHTRYTPADQINASNFEDLEVVWQWSVASFGPSTPRATPTFINGQLITVTGDRRSMVALNPGTGELLWSFTEPNTHRWEYSMRAGYGKGIG